MWIKYDTHARYSRLFDSMSVACDFIIFFKRYKCCRFNCYAVKTFPSHAFVRTYHASSNYTQSISPHQPTDSIMISLLSYMDASVWFLPTFGAPISAHQTRGRKLSGPPRSPSPPVNGGSTFRSKKGLKLLGQLARSPAVGTITGARASRRRWWWWWWWWREEESASDPSVVAELAAQQRRGVGGGPAGSQSDGDPDAPLFALRAGDEWKHENNGRAEHAHTVKPQVITIHRGPTFSLRSWIRTKSGLHLTFKRPVSNSAKSAQNGWSWA